MLGRVEDHATISDNLTDIAPPKSWRAHSLNHASLRTARKEGAISVVAAIRSMAQVARFADVAMRTSVGQSSSH